MQFSFSALVLLGFSSLVSSSLTITIPSSGLLPNPHVLPATTHATLTTLPSTAEHHILSTSLTRAATFKFELPAAATAESYLLDIRSAGGYVFAPYRVDVAADGSVLGIWETFRGNPWDNRGVAKYVVDVAGKKQDDVVVEAKSVGRKVFYEERATCELLSTFVLKIAGCANTGQVSPLSLLKSPMVLLAVVALGLMFVMPKLMENSTFLAYLSDDESHV